MFQTAVYFVIFFGLILRTPKKMLSIGVKMIEVYLTPLVKLWFVTLIKKTI